MITFLTDFGTADPYVGIMKGVVFSVNPSAVIIDITHEIMPQDIAGAAFCIYSAYPYFPSGTIHVVVVDPGVGSHRSILLVSMAGHFFLAPDNGVLSLILKSGKVDSITSLENERYFLKPVSQTFHGRDIFAPVAGHLSKGLQPDQLGPEIKPNQAVFLNLPMPYLSAGSREIVGGVIRVDRFGNLITNINQQFIDKAFGGAEKRQLKISVEGHQITGVSDCYQDVSPLSLVALVGSMGFIEISANCGNASEFCGASKGSMVSISVVEAA